MEREPELNLEAYAEVYSNIDSQAKQEKIIRPDKGKQIFKNSEENQRVMRDRKLPPKGVDFRGTDINEVLLQQ